MSCFRRTARRLAPLLATLGALGCISIDLPTGRVEPLLESTVGGDTGSDKKVLILEIEGVILETPEVSDFFGTLSEGMAGRLREELDRAREDDAIVALLLRINSPGGTVTGSDLVYREIQRFKQERRLPVVAQMMGLATSGGYYVAMAADEVRAEPTSVTGSIGVIFAGLNLTGLMEKIGVEDQTLTSGEFKDAGSMLRPMRPEEREQLRSVLDDLYTRFVEVVRSGRSRLSPEQIDALADGRIFSAAQALERGLVDGIGSIDDALERASELARVKSVRAVTYHRPREYANNYYTRPARQRGLGVDLWPRGLRLSGPAFLYLWAPGLDWR